MFLVDEFPNTNANLIPIGNIKSQVTKALISRFSRLGFLLISTHTLTHLYPVLKGNRSTKISAYIVSFVMFFWTNSNRLYIKTHILVVANRLKKQCFILKNPKVMEAPCKALVPFIHTERSRCSSPFCRCFETSLNRKLD